MGRQDDIARRRLEARERRKIWHAAFAVSILAHALFFGLMVRIFPGLPGSWERGLPRWLVLYDGRTPAGEETYAWLIEPVETAPSLLPDAPPRPSRSATPASGEPIVPQTPIRPDPVSPRPLPVAGRSVEPAVPVPRPAAPLPEPIAQTLLDPARPDMPRPEPPPRPREAAPAAVATSQPAAEGAMESVPQEPPLEPAPATPFHDPESVQRLHGETPDPPGGIEPRSLAEPSMVHQAENQVEPLSDDSDERLGPDEPLPDRPLAPDPANENVNDQEHGGSALDIRERSEAHRISRITATETAPPPLPQAAKDDSPPQTRAAPAGTRHPASESLPQEAHALAEASPAPDADTRDQIETTPSPAASHEPSVDGSHVPGGKQEIGPESATRKEPAVPDVTPGVEKRIEAEPKTESASHEPPPIVAAHEEAPPLQEKPAPEPGRKMEEPAHSPGDRPVVEAPRPTQIPVETPLGVRRTLLWGPPTATAIEKEKPEKEEAQPDETPPRLLERVAPAYPVLARRLGIEGSVTLQVELDAEGSPQNAHVALSSGRSDLDAAAREAVLKWRFAPARRAGHAVPADVTVTIEFRLID